ncbi:PH domain protein (macronuclear) [Tetrahymena thermophila SB210]|uniref:PH domain protein n=1 Tax=Tetrahymena thermophila (strain SB210) TaxID=312017 RepID=Q23QM4_TETTS|nr:PH domain protein [Tetrahymena thermophila SB210]EAR98864.2 PH domain protein [Tetrahymena thermophila SB210]|eukprot:XP_001019109.2 PH domain protein [Tetrahymena thermophila SB210]
MLKDLFTRLLNRIAGEYIVGLTKENLKQFGIFSGEVKIQNVSLNPSVIDILNLPISHQFSRIEKFELKAPIQSIGSKPVELLLDGLYLVVTPKEKKEWTFQDYNSLRLKLLNIETFTIECLQKIAAKQQEQSKSGEKDAGYMQKLTMKIVDNLQVTIKNIHVRFEDTITKRYSWGFCLDKIETFTINKDGEQTFIDRTVQANKNEPTRKLLIISNAGIYWNAHEERFIYDSPNHRRVQIMNGMIMKEGQLQTEEPVDFLLKISFQVSLIMNNKGNFEVPEIQVKLNLDSIDLHLQQRQLQQIIEQLEYAFEYAKEIAIRKKNNKNIDAQEIERLSNIFSTHHNKIMQQDKDNQTVQCLSEVEKAEYEDAVIKLDIEILQERAKKIIFEIQKAIKIKELENKKKGQKQGFMSYIFKAPKDLITEDEKNQIKQFIDENFSEEAIDAPKVIRPKEYVYCTVDLTLKGACIKLSNDLGSTVQCLLFQLNYINGNFKLREENSEVKVTLKSLQLKMIDEFLGSNTAKTLNILNPTIEKSTYPLIECTFISNPLDAPHIDKVIDIKIRSVRFNYDSHLVLRLTQFFDIQFKDEQFKQSAQEQISDQIHKEQFSLQERMKNDTVLKFNLDLDSPVIVIPLKQNGMISNQAWVINLGNLKVNTIQDVLKPNLPFEIKALDMYNIQLSKTKLTFFESIELYNNYINSSKSQQIQDHFSENSQFYNTVDDFSINLSATLVKQPAQGKIQKANILIEGGIDKINLRMNPSVYEKLLSIGDCFEIPIDELKLPRKQTLEQVEQKKNVLLSRSIKSGIIFKRGKTLKNWVRYTGVLSGGYIYLFSNSYDLKAQEVIWVKNSIITRVDESIVGFKNAFSVKNKYTDIYFACEKENATNSWIENIEKIRTQITKNVITEKDLEQFGNNQKLSSNELEKQQKNNLDQILIESHFQIGNIQLSLFDETKYSEKPFLVLKTQKLALDYFERKQKTNVGLALGGLFLSDYLYSYKDNNLNDFITSSLESDQNQNDLIQVSLIMLDKGHPEYQNVDLNIDLKFNNLTLNYKPDTLAKILTFFQAESNIDFSNKESISGNLSETMASGKISSLNSNNTKNQGSKQQESPKFKNSDSPSSKSQDLQDCSTILLQANVQINQIKIVLINFKNRLPINDLQINNINIETKLRSDEIAIKSSLGNLRVRDSTNYPNTIYSEEDWKNIQYQEILGILNKNNSSNLLEVDFRMLFEGSSKIQSDNVDTFVNLVFNSIHLNYIQAPVLRFIDYILQQFLECLENPNSFIHESEIVEKYKISFFKDLDKAQDPVLCLDKIGGKKIAELLEKPLLFKLDILIKNPLITLKPNPQSGEYLQADLGVIKVTNKVVKDSSRLLECKIKNEIKETYSDIYEVNAENMLIRVIKGDQVTEITQKFNLNVSVNLANYFYQYKYIYGNDIKIDTTIKVYNHISPIIFRISNENYNLIMKCVMHNIAYDDGCDRFLVNDWERNQKPQAVLEKMIKKQEDSKLKRTMNLAYQYFDKDGVFVQVDLENLSVFALDQENNLPFVKFTVEGMRVIQIIDENIDKEDIYDKTLKTKIYAKKLNASCFSLINGEYVESSLLGEEIVQKTYSLEELQDINVLINNENQYNVQSEYQINRQSQIQFEFELLPNDDKEMEISIQNCKVQAKVRHLLAIADFFDLDASVDAPEPVFKVELTQEQIQEKQKAEQQIKQYNKEMRQGVQTKLKINIQNFIICTPCPDEVNVIAIRCELDFNLKMQELGAKQTEKSQYYQQMSNQKNIAQQINETINMSANLKKLEIFICNQEELKTKDFKKVLKRNILLPLDLNFKKIEYLLPQENNLFSNKTSIETQLLKAVLKITFQDLTLVNQTIVIIQEDIKNQPERLSRKVEIPLQEKDKIQSEDELNVNQQTRPTTLIPKLTEEQKIKQELEQVESKLIQIAQHQVQVNEVDLFIDIQGLEIIIINDLNSSYVPVLDLNLYEMNVKFNQNNIQAKLTSSFELGAEYYNAKVGLWEPIIEKVGFTVDFIKSEVSNVKQLITIEMNPNYRTLNLTVSTQFLYLLSRINYTIRKEIIPAVRKTRESYIWSTNFSSLQHSEVQKEETSDEENLQEISPYAVRNETGYPIEIITDLNNIQNSQNIPLVSEQKIYKCYLNNFQEKNFKVDMMESKIVNDKKETFVFKKSSEQVKVKVLVPNKNLKYIQQIDLDKVRSSLRVCKNENNIKLYYVITEVKLDNFTFKKVLNISSPYQFFNGCNYVLQLTIFDENQIQKQVFNIKKNQKFPIPIDLLNGFFSVTLEKSEYKSKIYNYNVLRNSMLNQAQEIQLSDKFLILRVNQDIQNQKCTIFSLEPPYKIKNCLPKPILFQFINNNSSENKVARSKRQTDSSKNMNSGQVYEFYNCSQNIESVISLQIPNHFYSNEAKMIGNQIERVAIKDFNGNQSEISIHQKEQTVQGCKYLYIYCKGYLINESPQKLNIYTSIQKKKSECRIVGGQNQIYEEESLNTNFILFGNDTGEQLSIQDYKYDKISQPVSIGGVGTTQLDLYTLNDFLIPIYQTVGVNVSIKNVDYDQKLFSKVITISPRFILVNKTGHQIYIKQKGYDDKVTAIEKDTRIPLFWYDQSESRFLSIKLQEEANEWNWSGNLNVQELGTVNFMVRSTQDKLNVVFLRTDVRSDDSNIYIVIEKVSDKEKPYLIQNLTSSVTINLYDFNVSLLPLSENYDSAQLDQQYHFSWEHPFDREKKLYLQLIPKQKNYQLLNYNLSPDQIYLRDKLQLSPQGLNKNQFQNIYIKLSIEIDGFTRIIKFEDSYKDEPVTQQEKEELRQKIEKQIEQKHFPQNLGQPKKLSLKESQQKNQEESNSLLKNKIEQQISVYIKQIGISVVQNHRINEKPKEIIYVTIKGVEFITIKKQELMTNQLRVKLLNIDQNNSYNISNPVILTPNKYSQYNKDKTNNFFINIMVEQNLVAKNLTLFNNLVLEIDPFTIRIEDQLVNVVQDFINTVEEVQYTVESSHLSSIKNQIDESASLKKNQNKNKKFKWQECEIPPSSIPTFINQLILSNIEANLIIKGNFKTSTQSSNFFKQIFSALGVVLADIESPIKLNGIKLINCFETPSGITSKLTDHYKTQAIREVLKACGSFNIIGNPVGLFQNISTGVIDLIQKPAEGFVKGPLEGGLGIMEGASSLIKNTMAGAFNSVNKITGSLSSGVSALCMDEEYLQERERKNQIKPKNVLDGATQGITSIVSGVTKGITGVLVNPFEGAKKGGAFGLLKGVGLGIAGLITKPVSGVLDAASSVTGGIKNNIMLGDEKANEVRLRNPRVFYGREGFYKEFIEIDAAMKAILHTTSKGKYQNVDYLQAYLIDGDGENQKNNVVLVISYEIILLFDASRKKKWYFETSGFCRVELKQNGIQLYCQNEIQKLKNKSAFVAIKKDDQKEYIFNQINTLKFQLEEEKKISQLDN